MSEFLRCDYCKTELLLVTSRESPAAMERVKAQSWIHVPIRMLIEDHELEGLDFCGKCGPTVVAKLKGVLK